MAIALGTYKSSYYIKPSQVTLMANDQNNPSLVYVGVRSGTYVEIYYTDRTGATPEQVIGYGPNSSYQKWQLSGSSTKLASNAKHYIYIRLRRTEKTAMLIFSTRLYDFYGENPDGVNHAANRDLYYYILAGELTATDGTSQRELTFQTGNLSTPENSYDKEEADSKFLSFEIADQRYLNQVEDDTAKGIITFLQGIKIGSWEGENTAHSFQLRYDETLDSVVLSRTDGKPAHFLATGALSTRALGNIEEEGTGGGMDHVYNVDDFSKALDSFNKVSETDTFNAYAIRSLYEMVKNIENSSTDTSYVDGKIEDVNKTIDTNTAYLSEWIRRTEETLQGNIDAVESALQENIDTVAGDLSTLRTTVNDFLTGTDTDNIINRWKELESFLNGYTETATLADLLSGKADKATTLAGYGITNAYTKTEVDSKITSVNTGLTTLQTTVSGHTTSINSLQSTVSGHTSSITSINSKITTLQGYFTNGVANSALRLSDGAEYKAWGQVFFKDGKPVDVSGEGTFTQVNADSVLFKGKARLSYDSTLDALLLTKDDGTVVHFLASGAVATRGLGEIEEGGGGTGTGVDLLNVPSDIIPIVGGTYSLGSSANAWKMIYANGGIIGNTYIDSARVIFGTYIQGQSWAINPDGSASLGSITSNGETVATRNWVNSQSFAKTSDLSNYVTLNTEQTISGKKTFTGGITVQNGITASHLYSVEYLDSSELTINAEKVNFIYDGDDADVQIGLINGYKPLTLGNTSFSPALTSGTVIGTITIGGESKTIYAPSSSNVDLSNYVTLDGEQTITGSKYFSDLNANSIYLQGFELKPYNPDGGIPDRLMYDGYVLLDEFNYSEYLDSAYVKKSGDTMTGQLGFSGSTYPHIYGNGSNLILGHANQKDYGLVLSAGNVRGHKNNNQSLGGSTIRWSNVYSVLGNFSGQITSSVAGGTAPFVVASKSLVKNLNAEYVNGYTVNRAGFVTNTDGTTTMIPTLDKQCNVYFSVTSSSYWTKFATITALGNTSTVIVTLLVGHERKGDRYQGRGILECKIRNANSTPSIYFSAVSGDIDCSSFRCYYPTTISSGTEIELWVNVKRSWNSAVIRVLNETSAYAPINVVKMFTGARSSVETPTLEDYVEPERVSLATKLSTARTLWGQSFDGSGNVSGDLTGVGSITGTAGISINTTGKNGILLRYNSNDATSVALYSTAFRPMAAANGVFDLGSTSARWKGIFGQSLDLSGQITSSVADGTAPFVVASKSLVKNLNATYVNGYIPTSGVVSNFLEGKRFTLTDETAQTWYIKITCGNWNSAEIDISVQTHYDGWNNGVVFTINGLDKLRYRTTFYNKFNILGYKLVHPSGGYTYLYLQVRGYYKDANNYAKAIIATSTKSSVFTAEKVTEADVSDITWDVLASNANYTDGQIISSVADGTAPFVVASKTLVSNLNADMLDGKHLSEILASDITGNAATATYAQGSKNTGYIWHCTIQLGEWCRIMNMTTRCPALLQLTFSGAAQQSCYTFLIGPGHTSYGFISQIGATGYSHNSSQKIRITRSPSDGSTHYVEVYNPSVATTVRCRIIPLGSNSSAGWNDEYTYYTEYTPTTEDAIECASIDCKYDGIVAKKFYGEAATATKLHTARTLWGQSFDGSGNISGDLTGVGSITGTAGISINTTGKNGILLRYNSNDATSVALYSTAFSPMAAANGVFDLGSTSARWKGIFGQSLDLSGNATVGGETVATQVWVNSQNFVNVEGGTINNAKLTGDVTGNGWSIEGSIANFGEVNADSLYVGGEEVLTSNSLANYVTLNTEQTISERKTFSKGIIGGLHSIEAPNSVFVGLDSTVRVYGGLTIGTGDLKAPSIQSDNVLPKSNNSGNIGTSTTQWLNGYINSLYSDAISVETLMPRNSPYISVNALSLDLYECELYGYDSDNLDVWNVDFAGNAYFLSVTQSSDVRYKNIKENIHLELADIAAAPTFKFAWANETDGNTHLGTSAQYWQEIASELVTENKKTGKLGLDYSTAALVSAISIAREVNTMKMWQTSTTDRIEELEDKVKKLEEENKALRELLNSK